MGSSVGYRVVAHQLRSRPPISVPPTHRRCPLTSGPPPCSVQQRNGRKCLTTVQGLPEEFDYKKILKALKKGAWAGLGGRRSGSAGLASTQTRSIFSTRLTRVLPLPPLLPPEYCCNGTVVEDEELGKVLQLQGDQRKQVSQFIISNELAKKVRVVGAEIAGTRGAWAVNARAATGAA